MTSIHLKIERHYTGSLFGSPWLPSHLRVEIGSTVCGSEGEHTYPFSPMGSLECWELAVSGSPEYELCSDCAETVALWELSDTTL